MSPRFGVGDVTKNAKVETLPHKRNGPPGQRTVKTELLH